MHSEYDGKLIPDALSQDCKNFSFDLEKRIFSFDRQLNTCDVDDYVIKVSRYTLYSNKKTKGQGSMRSGGSGPHFCVFP